MMATDEEIKKEADDLLCEFPHELTSYDYIIKGIKRGLQMEKERIRKRICDLNIKSTGNIRCDDLEIWDDVK